MAKKRLVTTLGLFAAMSLGCGSLKELVEGKQEAPVEPVAEPTPAPAEQPPAANPWRVILVLDRTPDRSFEYPGPALESSLADTDVQLITVTDANPVELKGSDGAARGRLELATITDAETGYVFAEEGRPPTYLAPAGLAVVLQQAGAYFGTTFARPSLPAGGGPFGDGKAGKAGKAGHPMSPENMKGAKIKARQRAGAPVAPGSSSTETSGE